MTTARHLAILLPLAALLFFLNLGKYDIAAPDEPRFAQVAREMLRSGDFLVPHVNGETYLEKPPLMMWAMLPAALIEGDVTALAARLPSAIGALITVLFTYLLARRMFGPRIAFWSALILMTCVRIFWQARVGQIDMLLTACMTVSIYALFRFDEDRRPGWLFLLYGGMALGLLAKGPPALLFPLLAIAFFYWRNPWGRKATHWILGTCCALAVVLAWFIPARIFGADTAAEALQEGVAGNLVRNTLGRVFLGVSKAQPPWYYLLNVPVDLLPWSLFLPAALPWLWRNRKASRPGLFLWCWIVPAFIVFSIIVGKRQIYLLPLFPAFAIVLAASIDELMRGPYPLWRRNTGLVWAGTLVLLGTALIVAPNFTLDGRNIDRPELLMAYGAGLLALGGLMLWFAWQRDGAFVDRWFAATTLTAFAGFALVAPPVMNQFKSAADFCAPVRELAHAGESFRLYSVGFSREEFVYHADHFHVDVFTELIDVPELAGEDYYTAAEFQVRARKLIADAVEEVPIADMNAVTDADRKALRDAIEAAIAEEAKEESLPLVAFEEALIREVQAFHAEFTAAEPAFLFVKQEDWRWLLPFWPVAPPVKVLGAEGVGNRDVLLLANESGARLASR